MYYIRVKLWHLKGLCLQKMDRFKDAYKLHISAAEICNDPLKNMHILPKIKLSCSCALALCLRNLGDTGLLN
jgi:hypothetical protein